LPKTWDRDIQVKSSLTQPFATLQLLMNMLGSIYKAVHVHTGQVMALKVQDVDHECPTNRYERHLYPSLQGGEGMPTLWASGVSGKWDYLVIDLLGASVDQLFRRSRQDVMDVRSVCALAIQVVRIPSLHGH
jgi:hypothetical protein